MPAEIEEFAPFPHNWQSTEYVSQWIRHDAARDPERRPLLQRMLSFAPFPREDSCPPPQGIRRFWTMPASCTGPGAGALAIESGCPQHFLRHFHIGTEILAFIRANAGPGVTAETMPLRPRALKDLEDNVFLQHDLNVFNFINWANPGSTLASSTSFGLMSNTRNATSAPGIGSGEPFNMQLAAKVIF